MVTTTNKLDYVMKKYIVTKDNLEQVFAQYPTKRKIRTSQVRNLVMSLKRGKSFPVMYVNRGSTISTKNVTLDGNHRLEALRDYFSEFPDASVELNVGIYDISDPDLEKEKFLELNNIVKPSSDDIIQQHVDDNWFLKKLLRQVDICSIYGGTTKPLKVRMLMAAYIQATKTHWIPGAMGGKTIVAHMTNMDQGDLDHIKAFLQDYQEAFGVLTKDSIWMSTTIFTTMIRIWYQNKSTVPMDKMQKKWRMLINHPYVIEYSKIGGREACRYAGDKFIEVMDRTRPVGFVIEQELEVPEIEA